MAARRGLTRATSRPAGVPMATEIRKPRMPRESEVQMVERIVPCSHC